MRQAQCGEDAGQQGARIQGRRGVADARQRVAQRLLHLREAVGAEHEGVEVALEVEPRHLGRDARVLEAVEDFERAGRGVPCVVDEHEFLLGADAADAGLDRAGVDHALEGAEVVEEPAHEPRVLSRASGSDFPYAHRVTLK